MAHGPLHPELLSQREFSAALRMWHAAATEVFERTQRACRWRLQVRLEPSGSIRPPLRFRRQDNLEMLVGTPFAVLRRLWAICRWARRSCSPTAGRLMFGLNPLIF